MNAHHRYRATWRLHFHIACAAVLVTQGHRKSFIFAGSGSDARVATDVELRQPFALSAGQGANLTAGSISASSLSAHKEVPPELVSPVGFPAAYLVVPAALCALVIAHELVFKGKPPVLAAQLPQQTGYMQFVFLLNEVVLGVEMKVVVPSSYILAQATGQGATMSALLFSGPFLGAIFGTLLSGRLLKPYSQVFTRYLIIVLYVSCAAGHLASALLLKSNLVHQPALLFWSIVALRVVFGVAAAPVKVATDLGLGRITPKADQVKIAILTNTCQMIGGVLGPGLASLSQLLAPGGGAQLSPYDQMAWPELVTSVLVFGCCLVYASAAPLDLPERGEEQSDPSSREGEDPLLEKASDEDRQSMVSYALYATAARLTIVVGLLLSTVLLLETQYAWGSIDSGFAMTCVAAMGIVVSLFHLAAKAYNIVTDSSLLFVSSMLGCAACCFLFDLPGFGFLSLLLADGFILSANVVGAGIFIGWARRAAKPDTAFSLQDFSIYYSLVAVLVNLVAPVLARGCVEFGSRNGYAGMQLVLSLCNLAITAAACRIAGRSPAKIEAVDADRSND